MAIETLGDAIGVTKVLYQGKSNYLFANLDWWGRQLGLDRPLAGITPEDVDQGIGVLIETPVLRWKRNAGSVVGGRAEVPATINRYIGSLATMYKLLRLHRRLPRSFVSPIVRGMKMPESTGRTLQVTLADVQRLVDAARLSKNPKLAALVAVACTTGLRKGSLQSLTWGQVNLKARTLDVATTKNGTPTRSILPQWAAAELTRIRPTNPEPEWVVFGRKDFKRAWASTLERAAIPGSEQWTFHRCRHIAASVLAQSGCSLPVMMQALNHKSPAMSLRYSHVNTKALDQAISTARSRWRVPGFWQSNFMSCVAGQPLFV